MNNIHWTVARELALERQARLIRDAAARRRHRTLRNGRRPR
jgi:hypothetical protein